MSRACVRAVRALSVAAGTQQPAARPVPLFPSSSAASPGLPPPIPWLCGLHLKFPWRRRLGAAAGAKTPGRRAILGVALLPAPAPHRTRLSAGFLPTWREQGVARIREEPRLLTADTACLPNAFVGSLKKTGSAAKLPERGQGRFPRPSKVVPVSVATGVRVWGHLGCQRFRTFISSLAPLKRKS